MDKKNKIKESKIEHLWTIVCGSGSVDNETNILSLFNITEEIVVQIDPKTIMDPKVGTGVPIPLEIITCFFKDPKYSGTDPVSVDLKIDFTDPEEKILQTINHKVEIQPQHSRMRVRMKSNGLKITKQGQYNFLISFRAGTETAFVEATKVPLFVKMPVPTDLNILKR